MLVGNLHELGFLRLPETSHLECFVMDVLSACRRDRE
jgi:hypothetical protein